MDNGPGQARKRAFPGPGIQGPRVLPGQHVDAAPPIPRGCRAPAAGADGPAGGRAIARTRGRVAVGREARTVIRQLACESAALTVSRARFSSNLRYSAARPLTEHLGPAPTRVSCQNVHIGVSTRTGA